MRREKGKQFVYIKSEQTKREMALVSWNDFTIQTQERYVTN